MGELWPHVWEQNSWMLVVHVFRECTGITHISGSGGPGQLLSNDFLPQHWCLNHFIFKKKFFFVCFLFSNTIKYPFSQNLPCTYVCWLCDSEELVNIMCVFVCVFVVLVNVLMAESDVLLLEATRVCGNLSRYPAVRDILRENKGTLHLSCTYCAQLSVRRLVG